MEVKWELPHLGSYKLNTVSVKQSTGPGGIGGLIRIHLGHRIIGFSEHTPHTNPVRAKLLAIRRGLQIAVNHSLIPIEINFDSIETIHMLTNRNINMLYDNIVVECRCLMLKLKITKVTQVFREQNRAVDKLAKEGTKVAVFDEPNILLVPPMYARRKVETDILGTMYTRLTNNIPSIFQGRDVTQLNRNGHHAAVDAPIHYPS
ncbi:hypothetical protein R3W88_029270 [Solanum pinnatisectum]|uniref:RNase H type-1 domain-containing protein n=1 Tax=Solanum pinnatisectum TaxID=50273 RepID=A0AAV9K6K2_9SOLN|nr:hypothetical protein R3W88_029270 [Solanum pinnatisectum]